MRLRRNYRKRNLLEMVDRVFDILTNLFFLLYYYEEEANDLLRSGRSN